MNKHSLVKFSLTLVSAAVLAACSSGGGSSNDDTAAREQAAAVAAAEKAAAEKAAAEKAAAEKVAAEKAAAEKAAAEAEEKVKNTLSVGHKLVKKTNSNFVLHNGEPLAATSSTSTGRSDNMDVELYPSLDTVVVSVPLKADGTIDETAPIGYVEDFDFRGNTESSTGEHTLEHIYKTANGATLDVGSARGERNSTTKTETMGNETGKALVYQTGRTNYIPTDEVVKGPTVGDVKVEVEHNGDFRDRSTTVAEVYGHRTFVNGDAQVGVDAGQTASYMKDYGADVVTSNAPFLKLDKGVYTDGQLSYVQYGRVTSKLHKVEPTAVKAGVNVGKTGTKVVSYGEYDAENVENNYFYRGKSDTAYSATLAKDLAKAYYNSDAAEGKLTYQGHAVTYGFEHIAPAPKLPENKVAGVPNAIGELPKEDYNRPVLVSGTHAHATIDLASKAVTGNLYDVWNVDGTNTNANIATFTGTLANNGTISGTSARTSDAATGSFNGNLFGTQAQELGGALASDSIKGSESWGAVFGAKVQETPYVAPVVVEEKPSAWGVKTDQNN